MKIETHSKNGKYIMQTIVAASTATEISFIDKPCSEQYKLLTSSLNDELSSEYYFKHFPDREGLGIYDKENDQLIITVKYS